MKRRALIRHLTAHGCILVREGSDPSWWGNPASNRCSAVPHHGEINRSRARKICRDSGIPEP